LEQAISTARELSTTPWQSEKLQGCYSVPGFLIIPAGKSDARFVGHRPSAEVRWQANRHLWFQADYGIFYAGKFVKESQPGRNLNYWALWMGYKFWEQEHKSYLPVHPRRAPNGRRRSLYPNRVPKFPD
jgi:hypothetical protein